MPRARAGTKVVRIAGDVCDILLQQNARLVEAIARTDDMTAVRRLSEAIAMNADARSVMALMQANELEEAEGLILTMNVIRHRAAPRKRKAVTTP